MSVFRKAGFMEYSFQNKLFPDYGLIIFIGQVKYDWSQIEALLKERDQHPHFFKAVVDDIARRYRKSALDFKRDFLNETKEKEYIKSYRDIAKLAILVLENGWNDYFDILMDILIRLEKDNIAPSYFERYIAQYSRHYETLIGHFKSYCHPDKPAFVLYRGFVYPHIKEESLPNIISHVFKGRDKACFSMLYSMARTQFGKGARLSLQERNILAFEIIMQVNLFCGIKHFFGYKGIERAKTTFAFLGSLFSDEILIEQVFEFPLQTLPAQKRMFHTLLCLLNDRQSIVDAARKNRIFFDISINTYAQEIQFLECLPERDEIIGYWYSCNSKSKAEDVFFRKIETLIK